jgi:hypothetical protein
MKNVILLFSIVFFLACGTSNKEGNQKGKKPMTAESYATEVYQIWEESINELNTLIGSKPELTDKLVEKVNTLKEETIQKLLPYGREHAALSVEDQKSWSNKIAMKMGAMSSNQTWKNVMNECYQHYFQIDYKFGSLIASFNVITQYADFALLKKQLPAEADRLGI